MLDTSAVISVSVSVCVFSEILASVQCEQPMTVTCDSASISKGDNRAPKAVSQPLPRQQKKICVSVCLLFGQAKCVCAD